jgi:predicted Zn-ribbon and HTH transcriptional regulator
MKDWDKDKYIHESKMDDVPADVAVAFEMELQENATTCEDCGFVFLNDEISRNDFYTICGNCERPELRTEVEPLTWAEVYNWVYGIIQD